MTVVSSAELRRHGSFDSGIASVGASRREPICRAVVHAPPARAPGDGQLPAAGNHPRGRASNATRTTDEPHGWVDYLYWCYRRRRQGPVMA